MGGYCFVVVVVVVVVEPDWWINLFIAVFWKQTGGLIYLLLSFRNRVVD